MGFRCCCVQNFYFPAPFLRFSFFFSFFILGLEVLWDILFYCFSVCLLLLSGIVSFSFPLPPHSSFSVTFFLFLYLLPFLIHTYFLQFRLFNLLFPCFPVLPILSLPFLAFTSRYFTLSSFSFPYPYCTFSFPSSSLFLFLLFIVLLIPFFAPQTFHMAAPFCLFLSPFLSHRAKNGKSVKQ